MRASASFLVRIAPADTAMFRFLLEAHENLAFFTVLDKKAALLKIVFAPGARKEVIGALADMRRTIEFEWHEWPGFSAQTLKK